MIVDENVEMVRKAADALVARHGGLEGLVRHLQAMDRQRERKRKQRSRKPRRQNSKPK
jgi:hypothetical protein